MQENQENQEKKKIKPGMLICEKRVFPWIEIKMEPELMMVNTVG